MTAQHRQCAIPFHSAVHRTAAQRSAPQAVDGQNGRTSRAGAGGRGPGAVQLRHVRSRLCGRPFAGVNGSGQRGIALRYV